MNTSLNSFRAFAFLAVFAFHVGLLGNGYLGVHAFFVLSGFLLIPILLQTKATSGSLKAFAVNFYGRRALRIFPAYYLYLLVVPFVIGWVKLPPFDDFGGYMRQVPWALTYTYDFYHASNRIEPSGLLTHFWSLAVEEQFYMVFPLLIYFLRERTLKRVFLGLIVAGPVIRGVIYYVASHRLLSFIGTASDIVVYVLPFSHVDAFVMGGFFAVYARNYIPKTRAIGATAISMMLFGWVTTRWSLGEWKWSSLGYPMFMRDSAKYLWGYSLFALFFSLVLLRLRRRDLWRPIVENPVLGYLGKISYGLYIYHFPVLFFFNGRYGIPMLEGIPMTRNRACSIVFSLLATIAISIVSYEVFERHFLRLKDVLFAKKVSTAEIELVGTAP